MRIQSISEVNTNLQPNPFITQNTDSALAGRQASLISFEECLRAQIQDYKAPQMTKKAEMQAMNFSWGYHLPQGSQLKPDLKLRARAYESPSDM